MKPLLRMSWAGGVCSLFLAGTLLIAVPGETATITVTGAGPTYDLAAPCSSATIANLPGPDGSVTLPEAICAANNTAGADTITLGISVSLTTSFASSTSVGGGVAATPDITSPITIAAGAGNRIDRGGTTSPSYRMFYVAPGGSLTLSGVTVVGGHIEDGNTAGGDTVYGGGIYVAAGGVLNVINLSILGANAVLASLATSALSTEANVGRGGAIANFGTTTIDGGSILGNFAKGSEIVAYSGNGGEGAGGGIYNTGTLTVLNSSINTNHATGGAATNPTGQNKGGAARGAAIFNAKGATATISNTTFQGNIAFSGGAIRWSTGNSTGGALHNDGTIPSITGCTFDANIARPSFSYFAGNNFGAAIYNGVGATITTISSTKFTGNWSRMFEIPLPIGGSFLLFTAGTYLIQSWDELSLVGGNNQGGAIFNRGTIDSITSACEFSDNEARGVDGAQGGGDGLGGAIANGQGGVIHQITGALFQRNRARGGSAGGGGGDAKGGAIYNAESGQIDSINNCTFTANNSQGGDGFPLPTNVQPFTLIRTILSSGGTGAGGAIYDAAAVPAGIITDSAEIPQAHITSIDNATFAQNYAYGGGGIRGASGNGGAIYVGGKLDTITNSTFSKNIARGQFGIICSTARGGAIYLSGHTTIPGTGVSAPLIDTGPAGPLSISGTKILGNTARGGDGQTGNGIAEGGGIFSEESALTLTNLTVVANIVQGGAAFAGSGSVAGSAIKNGSGALNISLSLFSSNQGYAGGAVKGGDAAGAVWSGGNATISRSRFHMNFIRGGGGVAGGDSRGGGIFYSGNTSSQLTVSDVTFIQNQVYGGSGIGNCSGHGGGLYVDSGNAEVLRSTFTNNYVSGGGGNGCDGEGGGIFSSNAFLRVVNSTISGNNTKGSNGLDAGDGRGGGICVKGNRTVVLNSTITDNDVTQGSGFTGFQDGGGTFVQDKSTLALFSTILYGNTRGGGTADNCWGQTLSLDFNLIGDSVNCTLTGLTGNNRNASPNLSTLANNGGPAAPDTPTFTRALQTGSPAIDTGGCTIGYTDSSGVISNTVTTDQRGGTRGSRCDIGAFEAGASLTAPPSANPVFLGTPAPGLLALTGAAGSTASSTISVENVGGAGTGLNVTQVSLTAGYSITGLPIPALASGASTNLTVQCSVGTTGAGSLVLGTNEAPPQQYTYTLTCTNPAATAPRFVSNPTTGARLGFATDGTLHITVTNQGPPGTLLDVTDVSSNPGFTVASGMPIIGLGSGQSAVIILNFDPANQTGSSGLLVLQTNEPGTPVYEFAMPTVNEIPTLSELMLLALGCALGLFACARLAR